MNNKEIEIKKKIEEDRKNNLIQEIKKILQENDIQMNIHGCGCCGSPSISFNYKSKIITEYENDFNITMIK